MSDQDAFADPTDQKTDEQKVNDQLDAFAETLTSITRPDGSPKYDTLDKALDGLKNGNEHIQKLEKENKEMAAQLTKMNELEATISRLTEQMTNQEKSTEQTNPSGGLDGVELEKAVRTALEKETSRKAAQANFEKVNSTLTSKYGEGVFAEVQKVAQKLDISVDDLKQLSAKSPELVLKQFDLGTTTPDTTASTTSIRSPSGKVEPKVELPEQSLLSGSGATIDKQKAFLHQIRENVYKKFDVELS